MEHSGSQRYSHFSSLEMYRRFFLSYPLFTLRFMRSRPTISDLASTATLQSGPSRPPVCCHFLPPGSPLT